MCVRKDSVCVSRRYVATVCVMIDCGKKNDGCAGAGSDGMPRAIDDVNHDGLA